MGTGYQVFGMRGSIEKAEVALAYQLGVLHDRLAEKSMQKPLVAGAAKDPDQPMVGGLGDKIIALYGLGPPAKLQPLGAGPKPPWPGGLGRVPTHGKG